MGNDWTFEATDRVSGRRVTIDRRWRNWGPATRPTKYDGLSDISDAANALDERLYEMPDGDYVLVWRAEVYREYYECDYMAPKESEAWFVRQRIDRSDEAPRNRTDADMDALIAPARAPRRLTEADYRKLHELARRVSSALNELWSTAAELLNEYGDFDEGNTGLARAALTLAKALPSNGPWHNPVSAIFDDVWGMLFEPPAYVEPLVESLSRIDGFAIVVVKEMGLSRADYQFWADAVKRCSFLSGRLNNAIAKLEAEPTLSATLYAEALQELQARSSATYDEPPLVGDVVTPNGDIGICEASWPAQSGELTEAEKAELVEYAQACGIIPKQVAPATEAQPTDAAAGEARAVEPAIAAKERKDYNALATDWIDAHQDELSKDPWFLTDRKVAEDIGCSASTANGLSVIKAFKYRRGQKPKQGRGRSPRVTSYIEGTIGRPDEALERLMGERDDFEPSSLDDDPPGKPRRVKIEHREL